MDLTETTLATLLVVVGVLSLLAVTVAAVALSEQRRVRRAYATVFGGHAESEDLLVMLERYVGELAGLREDAAALRAYVGALREHERATVSRLGLVCFDAFEDMGGRLSFSAALLDERGDGLVITSIHGRRDTRVYAKQVRGDDGREHLSDEEAAAVAQAEAQARAPAEPPPAPPTQVRLVTPDGVAASSAAAPSRNGAAAGVEHRPPGTPPTDAR